MEEKPILMGESDFFVGRRGRLRRYLVCAMEGYFPVAVQTGANALAVILRTGAPHLGIMGTLAVVSSTDGGKSWSDPVEIAPRGCDCRNPALGVNGRGEWLAAYWKAGLHSYVEDEQGRGLRYQSEENERWHNVAALFTCRSTDGGRTWSEPQAFRSELLSLASPYGRIVTAPDGALLMPVYGSPRQARPGVRDLSILLRSRDGGATWGEETIVAAGYNETSFVFLPGGSLLAAARSTSGHIAILSSEDLGYTWSAPRQITRDGEHPADLTVLQSGRVLLTFGRRIRPMGCGALLSDDGGRTWDTQHEVLLAGDGVENRDLGYPSTVQLADGHLVTVLYYASGSGMSEDWGGWGRVSCQAIHYREEDLLGAV